MPCSLPRALCMKDLQVQGGRGLLPLTRAASAPELLRTWSVSLVTNNRAPLPHLYSSLPSSCWSRNSPQQTFCMLNSEFSSQGFGPVTAVLRVSNLSLIHSLTTEGFITWDLRTVLKSKIHIAALVFSPQFKNLNFAVVFEKFGVKVTRPHQ